MLISLSSNQQCKIKWVDKKEKSNNLVTSNSNDDLINKAEEEIKAVDNHKKAFDGKSVLKVKLSKS